MKLLTHNMLASNVPNVKIRFPLKLVADKVEVEDNECEVEFVVHMLRKIQYNVLRDAAIVCQYNDLPAELPPNPEADANLIRVLHHAMCNINVVEGSLQCVESGRVFPIKNGIPNMLLNDFELA